MYPCLQENITTDRTEFYKDTQDWVNESFVSRGHIKRKTVPSWKVLPDIVKTLLKDKH